MRISDHLANREAESVDWRWLAIDKAARAGQKFQNPVCVWLTGLSGSGKSTIAGIVEKRLFAAGRHT
jgi:bifunctional enzyme CysN/CysC